MDRKSGRTMQALREHGAVGSGPHRPVSEALLTVPSTRGAHKQHVVMVKRAVGEGIAELPTAVRRVSRRKDPDGRVTVIRSAGGAAVVLRPVRLPTLVEKFEAFCKEHGYNPRRASGLLRMASLMPAGGGAHPDHKRSGAKGGRRDE